MFSLGEQRVNSSNIRGKRSTIQSQKTGGKIGGILVGGVFLAIGLGLFYVLGVLPFMKTMQAKHWVETPCRIISAKVDSHRSSDGDGTSYSIDITYEYQVDGKVYRSDRYDFVEVRNGFDGRKRKVVNRYKRMADSVCYVNPGDPSEAVLVRGLTMGNAVVLFPLFFVVVGILAIWLSLRKKRGGWPWPKG